MDVTMGGNSFKTTCNRGHTDARHKLSPLHSTQVGALPLLLDCSCAQISLNGLVVNIAARLESPPAWRISSSVISGSFHWSSRRQPQGWFFQRLSHIMIRFLPAALNQLASFLACSNRGIVLVGWSLVKIEHEIGLQGQRPTQIHVYS